VIKNKYKGSIQNAFIIYYSTSGSKIITVALILIDASDFLFKCNFLAVLEKFRN